MKARALPASYKKTLQAISAMIRKIVEGQNPKLDKATVEHVYREMNSADMADAAFADLIAVMDHFSDNPLTVFKCLKLIYVLLELDHLRFFEIAQNFLPEIETVRLLNFKKVRVANRSDIHYLAENIFMHLTRDTPLVMPDKLDLQHIVVAPVVPRAVQEVPVVVDAPKEAAVVATDEDMIEWSDPVESSGESGETLPECASSIFDPFSQLSSQDMLFEDSPLFAPSMSPLVEPSPSNDLDVLWMPERKPTSFDELSLLDIVNDVEATPDDRFEPIVERSVEFEPITPVQSQDNVFEPVDKQDDAFEPIEQDDGFEPIVTDNFELIDQAEPVVTFGDGKGNGAPAGVSQTGSDMFEPLPPDELEVHSESVEAPLLDLNMPQSETADSSNKGRFSIRRHSLASAGVRSLWTDDDHDGDKGQGVH